jgi:RNA polymerase sigma-70 factor (ECF subfamily)
MSSEAAYFPEALTSTVEVPGRVSGDSQIPVNRLNTVRSQIESVEILPSTTDWISQASDDQLLERVREGRKEALGILFRRHARAVRNVAYRILRNEAEADDLVQDVFLFLFRKASLFDSERQTADSWIIHVAYHRAFDRRRYLNYRHFYAVQELDETSMYQASSKGKILSDGLSAEAVFSRQLMEQFNSGLTPEQKETIQLYFFEGYALKEIAQLTGRSLINVRNHYYRGLERMRKFVLPEKTRSK